MSRWLRQVATDGHQHFVIYENFGVFKRVISVWNHEEDTVVKWFLLDASAWKEYTYWKSLIEFFERSWK